MQLTLLVTYAACTITNKQNLPIMSIEVQKPQHILPLSNGSFDSNKNQRKKIQSLEQLWLEDTIKLKVMKTRVQWEPLS